MLGKEEGKSGSLRLHTVFLIIEEAAVVPEEEGTRKILPLRKEDSWQVVASPVRRSQLEGGSQSPS